MATTTTSVFKKIRNYLLFWTDAQVEQRADPKIQIQQAISAAQDQHSALTRQAASVIGTSHQLELKLDRLHDSAQQLQLQARQALVLADQAKAEGNTTKSQEFEQTASMIASQLVGIEAQVTDAEAMYRQAQQAAEQAKMAVSDNAAALQGKLNERTQLLGKLEQAKMQEQVSAALGGMSELTNSATPTLDQVRDKIEARYATALGATELASGSVEGRMLEVKRATMDAGASERLEQIRASMTALPSAADAPAAVEAPTPETVSTSKS